MKNTVPLLISGGLLTAAALILFLQSTEHSTEEPTPLANAPVNTPAKSLGDRTRNQSTSSQSTAIREILAARGHLWEPGANSPAQARRRSIPVRKEAFTQIRQLKEGDRVQLKLSPQIPALDSTITTISVHDDGTRFTHLHIPGQPEGDLVISEKESTGFFLAQLYYKNDPVAYEFRETVRGLIAKRHAVSELICAVVGDKGDLVAMGLPTPEVAEGGMFGGGMFGGGGTSGGSTPVISISNSSVNEGTGGTSSMTFTLDLTLADEENDITVDFTTRDGSATAPSDYTATTSTAVFEAGSRQTTISIPLAPDSMEEASETLAVILSNPSGATIANDSPLARFAFGIIYNDDFGASISTSNITTDEGDSGSTLVNFTVALSESVATSVTVDFATSDGLALAGSDYTHTEGSLTFLPGELTKQVSVEVLGDTDYEVDEDFSLILSNAIGAPVNVSGASCQILNDDEPPVPIHNSLPGATAVAFLDMDGHKVNGTSWNSFFNGNNEIDAQGVVGTLSQGEMTKIWKRVAEDFAPFELNVTTDEAAFLAAPPEKRVRCIITPTYRWYGRAGGVAFLRSFRWGGDTPCWTFSSQLGNNSSYIAEATSHEIGHTLGLNHDGRKAPDEEEYYRGHESDGVGWAPIMGVGYNRKLTHWSKGEYRNANRDEDDLALIAAKGYIVANDAIGLVNGFGFREDDHDAATPTPLDRNGFSVSGSGLIGLIDLIEDSSNVTNLFDFDTDIFSFKLEEAGLANIKVQGSSLGTNLDILAEIRDAAGNVLVSDNEPDLLSANPIVSLAAGTYYLHVTGTGKGDPLDTGYTEYGSLGAYTISGTITVETP